MSSTSQSPPKGSFFYLVEDVRKMIYSLLVSIKHTRTPKDAETCRHSMTFYNWNLHPVIFRLNKVVSEEAKKVMASENGFVVFELAEELMQSDPSTEYDVFRWPGKATKKPIVPGERMRVILNSSQIPVTSTSSYVILAEELCDVCVFWLPGSQGLRARIRPSDLFCLIKVHPPSSIETLAARNLRERALLELLPHLRYNQIVFIDNALPAIKDQVISQFHSNFIDCGLVFLTLNHLITIGDLASSAGDYDIATAYYRRAYNYFHYCDCNHLYRSKYVTDALAVQPFFTYIIHGIASYLKRYQHCALNWIRAGDFSKALEAAQKAITTVNETRMPDFPVLIGVPTSSSGIVISGSSGKSLRQCIEGTEGFGQAFKTEDIGRCYYYKSITVRMLFGNEMIKIADGDRLEMIRWCDISKTMREDVRGELMQLEIQTMKRFPQVRRKGLEREKSIITQGRVDESWGESIELRIDLLTNTIQ